MVSDFIDRYEADALLKAKKMIIIMQGFVRIFVSKLA